jgi:hypothetical protein
MSTTDHRRQSWPYTCYDGAAARLKFPKQGERQAVKPQWFDPQAKAAMQATVAARRQGQQAASAYRGVSWHMQTGIWVARISRDGRRRH